MEQEDYLSAEDKAAKEALGRLTEHAHTGALFADWKNTYCTQHLLKWLDENILDSRNRWLQGDLANAAEIRQEAKAYLKVKNWIIAQIKAGDVAALGIKKFQEEGIELQGLIKPPTPENQG